MRYPYTASETLPVRTTPGIRTVPPPTAIAPAPTYNASRLTERIVPLESCKTPR